MAKFLSWEHLTREQIVALRAASCSTIGLTARQVLQDCLLPPPDHQQQPADSVDACQHDSAILEQQRLEVALDLFSYTLKQGQVSQLEMSQLYTHTCAYTLTHTSALDLYTTGLGL